MKCLYYLTATLESASKISNDLHKAGVDDWFIHVLSKNEAGLSKMKIHASNYLEQLDILRFGILGAVTGLVAGLFAAYFLKTTQPFGPGVPNIVYLAVIGVATSFGAWEGGLIGIASENNKIALFHNEIESGKYLILIYAKKAREAIVKQVMSAKHKEAKLVAEDPAFFNPLAELKRI